MNAQLNVGDEIFLDIKRIGINGEGIGYYKKLAIFVDGVLPKENVLVKITKLYRGYATAELVELKTPSKDRVEPFCPYYTKCGGCSLQHVSYEATRDIKRDILMESITRYTKINPRSFEIKPTILMEDPHNYRAKVNLPAKNGMHGAVFGLYAPNSEKFIRIKGCSVQNDSINQIMDEVAKGNSKYHIIEVMACPGGCVAGAGTLLPVDLAAKVVGRYQSEAKTTTPLESPYRDRGEHLD